MRRVRRIAQRSMTADTSGALSAIYRLPASRGPKTKLCVNFSALPSAAVAPPATVTVDGEARSSESENSMDVSSRSKLFTVLDRH